MKNKTVKGKNSQQVLFLQGLLNSIKAGEQQQNKPFLLGVKEKHAGINFDLEIYPNCNNFITWRTITTTGEGFWQSWEEPEQIEESFRVMSLL